MRQVVMVLAGGFIGASFVVLHALLIRRKRWGALVLVPLDALILLLGWTAWQDRSLFESWMQEDNWVEWMTFFVFLIAGMVNFRAAALWPPDGASRWYGAALLTALGLFCLVVAGEEISWGQRLLAFQPPKWFLEENFQQELNLHNVLKDKRVGGFKLDSRYLVALIAVAYGLFWPAVTRVLPKLASASIPDGNALQRFSWERVRPSLTLAPYFAAIAMLSWTYPISLLGEACELTLGGVFLVDATVRASAPAKKQAMTLGMFAVAAVLGLAAGPVTSRWIFGADPQLIELTQDELERLREDARSGATEALGLKKSVHKRVFTAVRDGYFAIDAASSRYLDANRPIASGSRERVQYFLDPWNNPYWVLKRRASDGYLLYSFGPNRRRDTDVDSFEITNEAPMRGDDIGIWTN